MVSALQVDFIPGNVKSYEMSLLVDFEEVGQGLLSLPISVGLISATVFGSVGDSGSM